MFKEHFEYEDYNGVKREEDHYFYLSQPEIVKLNFSSAGGLKETVLRLTQEQNGGKIIELFERIIQMSIGRKSEDGRKFEKSPEIINDFVSTPMYPMLYMHLATDAEYATKFINAIVPKEVSEAAAKADNVKKFHN